MKLGVKSLALNRRRRRAGGGAGDTSIAALFSAANADGWTATYSSPPTFDPEGDPEQFTVTRNGFNASGTAITLNDTLTVMKRIRQAYPNEASLSSDQVSLSDFLYADDVVSGATNNSTRAYPKPIAMWLDHDLPTVTDQSYTAKLAVAHGHARNGRPVAAVKFIATDGTTTVEQTVSSMSGTSYTASGLTVPHFSATLDLSTLTDDALITIDAVIYPWVGEAYQASVDGATYPSINFCEMKVLNLSTEALVYAYVDGTGGGTPAVSETPATAEASPYADVGAALTAIQAYNNANNSRNDVTGGVVRLTDATHTITSFSSVTVGDAPPVIEAASAANKATTVLQNTATGASDQLCDQIIFKDITLKANNAGDIFLDNRAVLGTDNMLVTKNVTFDDNGLGDQSGSFVFKVGRWWAIETTSDFDGLASTFGGATKTINSIGCSGLVGSSGATLFNSAGSKDLRDVSINLVTSTDREPSAGAFFGHNFFSTGGNATILANTATIGDDGYAVVGNVLEKAAGSSNPCLSLNTDGNTPSQNVVVQQNTIIGDRVNYLYNDTNNVAHSGYLQANVMKEFNSKSDVFAEDGSHVGNWPVIHHVGSRNNAFLEGSSSGDTFGAGSWLGEVQPLNSTTGTDAVPIDPDWLDDASSDGTGAGDGDYTPGASTGLQAIPAGQALYPVDILGRSIPDDGTAYVGAVQQS